MTVRRQIAAERAGRDVTRRDDDAPDWDELVGRILGPRLVVDDTERRRADALDLAAAVQRAVVKLER
jgi:hypothetical protein